MKFCISSTLLHTASYCYFSDGTEEDESGQTCNTHQGNKRLIQEWWEREHFGDLGAYDDMF